jgi:hypothetical protein
MPKAHLTWSGEGREVNGRPRDDSIGTMVVTDACYRAAARIRCVGTLSSYSSMRDASRLPFRVLEDLLESTDASKEGVGGNEIPTAIVEQARPLHHPVEMGVALPIDVAQHLGLVQRF